MGSPITFSGFNQIDFSLVLNAVMQQESQPMQALVERKSALQAQSTAFGTLNAKILALAAAADSLGADTAFGGRSATVTDSTRVTVAPTSATPVGTYDVVVQELARAQVTGTSSAHADSDTTSVASGGSLTIGGVVVSVSGSVTLDGLADAINATSDIGVTASVVQTGSTSYQLVLTGKNTGAANAFSIVNNLTGGSGVAFGADAVAATDAVVIVNNITTVSATNVVENAIPGASLTLAKKDAATTVTVTIAQDISGAKSLVQALVTTVNELRQFFAGQKAAAATGSSGNLGRDGLLRGLTATLSSLLTAEYSVGGTYTRLGEVGLGFSRTGELTFDETLFDAALSDDAGSVEQLLVGDGTSPGAIDQLATALDEYTKAGGLVAGARSRTDEQVTAITSRIDAWEARLALRRAALQKEYIAADLLISRLNSQSSSLSSISAGYRLF